MRFLGISKLLFEFYLIFKFLINFNVDDSNCYWCKNVE